MVTIQKSPRDGCDSLPVLFQHSLDLAALWDGCATFFTCQNIYKFPNAMDLPYVEQALGTTSVRFAIPP